MATHSINIQVLNTPTGVAPSSDGIMGLFVKAVAVAPSGSVTGFNLNQAYLISDITDLVPLGITAAYDAANNTAIYQQVNEFYNQAGAGALLWLFGVAIATPFATFVASSTFPNLIAQTNIANPANRVKMIGFAYDVPQAVTQSNVFTGSGLNDLTYTGAFNTTLPGVFIVEIDGVNGVKTVTLGSGGTGYAVNDVLTVVHSGGSGATIKVLTVATGVIATFQVLTAGTGYAVAATQATTGGTGTGATFNVTALVDTFKYNLNGGSFTTGNNITSAAQSIGDGVSITFAATVGHTLNNLWTISYVVGNANTTGSNAFPTDVTATLTALTTAQQLQFNNGFQWSAIVDGYNMLWTATPETLPSQAANTAFPVSLCITSTIGNGVSQVGMALGRFARITVGHGFGAVGPIGSISTGGITNADGPVWAPTAFLTNGIATQAGGTLITGQLYTVIGGAVTYNSIAYAIGAQFTAITGFGTFTTTAGGYVVANSTPVAGIVTGNTVVEPGLSPTDITALGASQYMFLRTWFNYPGYYWNDAATCEASNLSLSTQEVNRVANKLAANALTFFTQYMQSGLPVQVATGNVDQSWLNATQAAFTTAYITPLINSGDISGATLIVTGVGYATNATLNFTLTVQGAPPLSNVTGTIQFSTTGA